MITREQLTADYLDWVNNYLTIEKFSEHRGLSTSEGEIYLALIKAIFFKPHPEA